MRQFMYVMPLGLIAAVVIFVAFPRARTFNLPFGQFGVKSRTGYSGLISLTGGGDIETSEQVVLLAASDRPDQVKSWQSNLLLRGTALETFDGVRWKAGVFDRKTGVEMGDGRVAKVAATVQEIRIQQEPSFEPALFYPGSLIAMSRSANVGDIAQYSNGSVARTKFDAQRLEYTARYAPVELPQAYGDMTLAEAASTARAVDGVPTPFAPPLAQREMNLVIPESVKSKPYFDAWINEVGLDPKTTSVSAAIAALNQHFQSKFEANLANSFSEADAFEAFLSKDRHGHCEYFATATTLFFRAQGIPARVVVGYKGGVFNRLIDRLEVREGNAHAWSEIFLAGFGWLPVDLTPAAVAAGDAFGSSFRLYLTAVSFWFPEYVVDYNFDSQRQLVKTFRGLASGDTRGPIDWKTDGARIGRVAIGVAILAVFIFLILRRRAQSRLGTELPEYYVKFLALASTHGVTMKIGETHAAFHRRAKGLGMTAVLVDAVDAALERDLYATVGVPAERRNSLRDEVEAATRQRRRS